MNDQLGPAARALLDAAREGLGPDPAAAARVKAKVAAAAVAGGATASLAGKLALLATAGAIAGGAVYATRDRGPEPAVVVAPAIVSAAPAREPVPPPTPERDERAERDVGEIELEPAVPPEPATPRRATPRRSRPAIELGREVELVDAAIRALRGGDPRGALAAVASHTRETAGKGQLAEDAAAIEIEALCALGDPGVAARLAAFDARWPRSAQRARLTTSCP